MQSFPMTDPSRVLVYEHVSPEGQAIPVLSDEQRQAVDGIHRLQAAAVQDPRYNGADARLPGRRQGLGFTNTGYSARPYNYRAPEAVGT